MSLQLPKEGRRSPRASARRRAHATQAVARPAVLLCAEEDDLSPELVRLIDQARRRGVAIEVVVLQGDDPMPGLIAAYPLALFVLLHSPALRSPRCEAIVQAFFAFRRPGHGLCEVELRQDDAAHDLEIVDAIACGLAGDASGLATAQPPPPPHPKKRSRMRPRRLIVADAQALAASLDLRES